MTSSWNEELNMYVLRIRYEKRKQLKKKNQNGRNILPEIINFTWTSDDLLLLQISFEISVGPGSRYHIITLYCVIPSLLSVLGKIEGR